MKRFCTVLLIAAAVLVNTSCAVKLIPDPSKLSATEASYMSAEIVYGGRPYNGLLITKAVKGNTFTFDVQGYYEGRIRVTSSGCGVNVAKVYTNSEAIRVTSRVDRDCLFALTVSPTYPNQKKSDVKVFPMIGMVAVKAINQGETWVGTVRKSTSYNVVNNWSIKTGDTLPVRVFLNGCGIELDQIIDPQNGVVTINLADATRGYDKDICVLDGVIISQEYQNVRINVLYNKYDSSFVPLAIPAVSVTKKGLVVKAETAVTLISLDNQVVIANEATFKNFDAKKSHILRIVTVKGRSVFGYFDASKGVWSWQQ